MKWLYLFSIPGHNVKGHLLGKLGRVGQLGVVDVAEPADAQVGFVALPEGHCCDHRLVDGVAAVRQALGTLLV